jgi:DNA (cytosine-5)-methyltransferase 1
MPTQTVKNQIVFADAFAGCGGLSLGLLQAGLKGRFAIEHDKFAFATLADNLLSGNGDLSFDWPDWLPKEPTSITQLLRNHEKNLGSLAGTIDLLVGGPPCQGFSSAGRRKHDDPRNELFNSYLRLVEILRPRAVLIENVRGFTISFNVNSTSKNYSQQLREQLQDKYRVFEKLIDLSQFGVPQLRTRYFVLAIEPQVCPESPFDALIARIPSFLRSMRLRAPVSSWAAISDLEIGRGGTRTSSDTPGFEEIVNSAPLTHYQRLMGAGTVVPTDLRLARHSREITRRFQEIIDRSHQEGRLNTTISSDLRARFGLKKKALRVLDPDRPSPTITSMPDDLIHYLEPRTLTVRENARLQSFPDWFSFKGKYTTGGDLRAREVPRFTQVANAVPPLAARAMGEMLIDILRKPTQDAELSSAPLQCQKQVPEVAT